MKHTVVACLLATVLVPWGASAQSLSIGKARFGADCQMCHGTPPRVTQNAARGANNPNAIRTAINQNKGGMGYLSGLTAQDLLDISAYLGNPSGVPASATNAEERVLNWAEWKFQALLVPRTNSLQIAGYTARGYSGGLYVGADATDVFLYSQTNGLQAVGSLASFTQMAASDGF